MKNLSEMKYMKKGVTKEWLKSKGFRYNRIFSENDNEVYTYRFQVYKYGDVNILKCELSVFIQSGEVRIDVYDCNTRNKYAPFYCVKYGVYDKMLERINKRIEKEIDILNIEEMGDVSWK